MTPPPGPRFTRLVSADVCHIDILDFKRAEVCPFSSVPHASRLGRSLVGGGGEASVRFSCREWQWLLVGRWQAELPKGVEAKHENTRNT